MDKQKTMTVLIVCTPQDYGEDTEMYAVRTTIERAVAWCHALPRFQVIAANPTWARLDLKVREWSEWITDVTLLTDLDALTRSEALKSEDVRAVLSVIREDAASTAMSAFQRRYTDLERYVVKSRRLRARQCSIDNIRETIARVRRIDKALEAA